MLALKPCSPLKRPHSHPAANIMRPVKPQNGQGVLANNAGRNKASSTTAVRMR